MIVRFSTEEKKLITSRGEEWALADDNSSSFKIERSISHNKNRHPSVNQDVFFKL